MATEYSESCEFQDGFVSLRQYNIETDPDKLVIYLYDDVIFCNSVVTSIFLRVSSLDSSL
ncbi:MAG: hypothetical protein ACTSQ4_09975 [Candidatus Heimdallarchaeaceae archaeon]